METKELAEIGILGILAESNNPLSVETVQERLQDNFDRYWEYGRGVLTPAFDRLETETYIQFLPEATGYEITPDGKDRLQSLLRQSMEINDAMTLTRRHHLVIQFGFLHHLPESEQVQLLNKLETLFEEEYERWASIADKQQAVENTNRYQGYRQDLIELNLQLIDQHIKWVQDLQPYSLS